MTGKEDKKMPSDVKDMIDHLKKTGRLNPKQESVPDDKKTEKIDEMELRQEEIEKETFSPSNAPEEEQYVELETMEDRDSNKNSDMEDPVDINSIVASIRKSELNFSEEIEEESGLQKKNSKEYTTPDIGKDKESEKPEKTLDNKKTLNNNKKEEKVYVAEGDAMVMPAKNGEYKLIDPASGIMWKVKVEDDSIAVRVLTEKEKEMCFIEAPRNKETKCQFTVTGMNFIVEPDCVKISNPPSK